jgi:hypothetical protein
VRITSSILSSSPWLLSLSKLVLARPREPESPQPGDAANPPDGSLAAIGKSTSTQNVWYRQLADTATRGEQRHDRVTQANELRKQVTSLAKRAADNPDMGLDAMREMFDALSHLQAEPTDVTYEETCGVPKLCRAPEMQR